jgi:hypothetical protein
MYDLRPVPACNNRTTKQQNNKNHKTTKTTKTTKQQNNKTTKQPKQQNNKTIGRKIINTLEKIPRNGFSQNSTFGNGYHI